MSNGNGREFVGDSEPIERPGADHGRYWNQAMDRAIDQVPEDESGPFDVRFVVTVRHSSPGWVDGYRVILTKI